MHPVRDSILGKLGHCFVEVRTYFFDISKFVMSYLRHQLFVMFNCEYGQIIKVRTFVSLQTTTISESTLEPCNTREVSAPLWLQPLATFQPLIKYYFSLEVIIKGVDLGRILELKSITYCFT